MKIPKHSFGDDEEESDEVPEALKGMLTQVLHVTTLAGIVAAAARFEAFFRAAVKAGLVEVQFKNAKTKLVFCASTEELVCRLNDAGLIIEGDVSLLALDTADPVSIKPDPKEIKLPPQKHPHRN